VEGINVLVTVGFLAVMVQLVIERVRAHVQIHPDLTNLIALVVGTGLAVGFDLQAGMELGFAGLPPSLDYLATGLVIAGLSGIVAARKTANRLQDPNSSVHERATDNS
jgi:hypothetical protein